MLERTCDSIVLGGHEVTRCVLLHPFYTGHKITMTKLHFVSFLVSRVLVSDFCVFCSVTMERRDTKGQTQKNQTRLTRHKSRHTKAEPGKVRK